MRAPLAPPIVLCVPSDSAAIASPEPPFATVEEALVDLRAGRFVVVLDDPNRKNQGDLTIAAELVTPDAVKFMATHAGGVICLGLTPGRCDELELPPMTRHSEASFGTAFTVSIEARDDITTGISAHDRARTIQVAADARATAGDLVRPGHIFPLRAHPDGVLERRGHTEAAVDLTRLAGLAPAAAICAILDDDGDVADRAQLVRFCSRHGLKLVTVADVVAHRRRLEGSDDTASASPLLARGAFPAAAHVWLA
ncbi:MAG: 3,4-dihydroxy 2-butanone 4-phosphate synthase / cyclohydrolase [bacterium]|nr:3,4-dihydroxy 2-butanone 4-phosphate synthase / cyclohydrolase [Solirubrobacteraceae bacterium]